MASHRTNSLRERDAALSDDELQNVVIDGGLTDDARELLDQELHRRGIADVTEYREYLQRLDQERLTEKQQALQRRENYIRLCSRMGYGISLFGIFAGLFALYIRKDARNGVGMIIARAILFPLVWIIARVRRLVWRFLLRP